MSFSLVLIAALAVTAGIVLVAGVPHPRAGDLAALLLLYSTIALRDLLGHARAVFVALTGDGGQRERLDQGRKAVALLVGRDTEALDEAGVVRACVESLAENLSDGVIAPLCWATAGASLAAVGGVPAGLGAALGAMLYKAINTMDSQFGYRNARYLHFGRCAARLDDLANLAPARLSALVLILAAPLAGGSPARAWRIWRRDHGQHASPNSGHPEAAMAGALGVQLGGPASYFGRIQDKPRLGDPLVPLTPSHISKACRLVLLAALLLLPCCAALGESGLSLTW